MGAEASILDGSLGFLMSLSFLFLASKEKREHTLIWQSWFCQLSQIVYGKGTKKKRLGDIQLLSGFALNIHI